MLARLFPPMRTAPKAERSDMLSADDWLKEGRKELALTSLSTA